MAGDRFERLWPHLHTFHFHERGENEHYEAYKFFLSHFNFRPYNSIMKKLCTACPLTFCHSPGRPEQLGALLGLIPEGLTNVTFFCLDHERLNFLNWKSITLVLELFVACLNKTLFWLNLMFFAWNATKASTMAKKLAKLWMDISHFSSGQSSAC